MSAVSYTKDLSLLGRDLALDYFSTPGTFGDADLRTESRGVGLQQRADLAVTADLVAADQLLANRLQTRRGELAPLGHPEYGSRHHELIGEPNVDRTRNLIKLYVLEALRHEPRIVEIVECRVGAAHHPPRDQVRIELTVRIIGVAVPRNLVVPFSLETGAGR